MRAFAFQLLIQRITELRIALRGGRITHLAIPDQHFDALLDFLPYPAKGLLYEHGLPWRGTVIDCVRIMPETEYKRLRERRAACRLRPSAENEAVRRFVEAPLNPARATDTIGEGMSAVRCADVERALARALAARMPPPEIVNIAKDGWPPMLAFNMTPIVFDPPSHDIAVPQFIDPGYPLPPPPSIE